MSSRLVRRHIRGTPCGAPRRPLGAVESAVLKLPLAQDKVPAAQGALDHLAQGAQGFPLAQFFLFWVVGFGIVVVECVYTASSRGDLEMAGGRG